MSKHEQGGPAFPIHPNMAEKLGCINSASDAGMTLRDFFAVFAMQAIISKFPLVQTYGPDKKDEKMIVRGAYNYADSMLEARSK